jgi:hypothetical protein
MAVQRLAQARLHDAWLWHEIQPSVAKSEEKVPRQAACLGDVFATLFTAITDTSADIRMRGETHVRRMSVIARASFAHLRRM